MAIPEHEDYAGWLARIVAAVNLIAEPMFLSCFLSQVSLHFSLHAYSSPLNLLTASLHLHFQNHQLVAHFFSSHEFVSHINLFPTHDSPYFSV